MSVYTIADLSIQINNKYSLTTDICKDYICKENNPKIDLIITPNDKDYENDKKYLKCPTEPYLESLSIYRQIARQMLDVGGFVMHASVVEKDGQAYAFAAKSGTGKSTHSRLWIEAFGKDSARIINGDKPLIRYKDSKFYVYGTPWCGKEGYNVNAKAPLKAICFLERSEENRIELLDKNLAVKKIFTQLLPPENPSQAQKMFDLIELLISNVKFYTLYCNKEKDAAIVAYNGMKE